MGCIVAAVFASGCLRPRDEPRRTVRVAPNVKVVVDSRTNLLPSYPCSECHRDRKPDPQERRLTKFHSRIDLAHGSGSLWCYRCHSQDPIDQLRLPDGTPVSFDKVYELCGGCHGNVLNDWRNGMHGLTTGQWNGVEHRAQCTFCHDPHRPGFPDMTPLPPPPRGRAAMEARR
jgi:hypothetical protein